MGLIGGFDQFNGWMTSTMTRTMTGTAPDFIIVGAAKSGTTIVWEWLAEHTGIFMAPVKEPHYFCFADSRVPHVGGELDPFYRDSLVTDRTHYQSLWQGAAQGQLCGEASPGYLYYPEAAKRIAAANPACKVVAILRNPGPRAFSQFMHHVRDGYEPKGSFEKALAAEPARIKKGWWWGFHYQNAGLYAAQWQRYCEAFPEDQRLLLLHDDLVTDAGACYRQICAFLGLPPQSPNLARQVNEASAIARVPAPDHITHMLRHGNALTHLAHRLLPKNTARKLKRAILSLHTNPAPRFSSNTRAKLNAFYRPDIEALAKLTGRDLSAWLR